MRIAVHLENHMHKDSYSTRWVSALKERKIDVKKVGLRSGRAIKKVEGCDGVMWHWYHNPDDKQVAPKILFTIESVLGIPVFPNFNTSWHFDEKIAQHYFFDAADVPKIPTWIFWSFSEAEGFIEECSYPIVLKLSVGAGSSNIFRIDNKKAARRIIRKLFKRGLFPYTMNEFEPQKFPKNINDALKFVIRGMDALKYIFLQQYPRLPHYYMPQKNYAYFQKFLPDNKNDIRITVIGNRAFGFIRYNRPNDFRASGSGYIDFDPNNIPVEAVTIAQSISHKYKFQSMAYDFLRDEENNILLTEISYGYADWAVHKCPGYWDRKLRWFEGHIWPEEAHVEDFIKLVEKKKQTTRK